MTRDKSKPTFQATRKLHYITRSQIANVTGIHVDALWALEETGRGAEQTWQAVISALNQLAKTEYTKEDFSDVVVASWTVVEVE